MENVTKETLLYEIEEKINLLKEEKINLINEDKNNPNLPNLNERMKSLVLIKSELIRENKSNSYHLTKSEEIVLLNSMAGKRQQNIKDYTDNGRIELAEAEKKELDIINEFLPKMPTEEEIKTKIFPGFFEQIFNELFELNKQFINNKNIFIIKDLFPTLLNIINNILLLSNDNISNNLNIIGNILSFINQYLNISFMETEIIKSTIDFLSISSNYLKENIKDKNSNEIKRIISKSIKLNKHIISYVYDNSINDNNFRYEIIELINNMIFLNDNVEFINNLIEYNICQQISNLQEYLLEEDKFDNIINLMYKSHIDLIYNLISTQSEIVIRSICIDNSCISNLFKFINNSFFLYNDNLKIIQIFDLIIESKVEYVHSLLLTEGIYDLYRNILLNNNDNEILLIILKDFSIMIQRGKNIKTSTGINYVSNHFIQKGILDLINNVKSRTDFDNQINYLLDEIPKLLGEKTK